MDRKNTFFYILISLLLISILISFRIMYVHSNKSTPKETNGELTLKESIELGLDTAKKWNENATLYKLTSVDEKLGGSRGDTGKRYTWSLFFKVPGTDKNLNVGILKGKIVVEDEIIESNHEIPIELDDIQLDSPELLKIVKNKYALQKGEDWATGYHFTLNIFDSYEGPTVTVIGIDNDKFFTKIDIDPKSGEITSANHKLPKGGGIISILKGSNTPKITKAGMKINGISANGDSLVTWGDQKPKGYTTVNQPFIELSLNSGETWNALDIHKNIVIAWFNSNKDLNVATETELFRTDHTGDKFKSIFNLKTQIEVVDYSNNNIAILSNSKIYSTNNNGEKWSEVSVPEPVLFLQTSKSGQVIVFTEKGNTFIDNDGNWDTLKLPTSEIMPTDLKVINDDLYFIIGNELWVYNLNHERWNILKNNYHFIKLIKKEDNLFGISEEGIIYLIDKGGDSIELKANRLFIVEDKIVSDVEITQKVFFIATQPDFIWEEIN